LGIELFERAAEARGRFLRAEQLQAAGGASDPQRGPGFLLTFDVGRILVAADPGNQSLLLRQVKNPEEVASIRLTELGEEEPWWRIVGDPLTAVWPVHRGGGAGGCLGARGGGGAWGRRGNCDCNFARALKVPGLSSSASTRGRCGFLNRKAPLERLIRDRLEETSCREKRNDMTEGQDGKPKSAPATEPPKSEAEWREQLSSDQFEVTRKAGTERAFSGQYWDTKTEGLYLCVCCHTPLFSSSTKYDSGSGWPSYYEPIDSEVIRERPDTSGGTLRTEVLCSRCDGHLGHVFPDGPPPTGLRYCINSLSLDFKQRGQGGGDEGAGEQG
jgi:peptide-methionine (R)-S-oxide reductase